VDVSSLTENDANDDGALIHLQSSLLTARADDTPLNFEIVSIHSDRAVIVDDSIDESSFQLHSLNDTFISLRVVDLTVLDLLVNRSVKFKLYDAAAKCYLIVDFVESTASTPTAPIVYYETLQYDTVGANELELDLSTILPEVVCDRAVAKPYSVTCLRCNLSPETSATSSYNSLALSLVNDTLTAKFDPFKSSTIYRDVYLLVSEEADEIDSNESQDSIIDSSLNKQYYLLVRIYNLNVNQSGFRDALIAKIDRRHKRFSKKSATNSSAPIVVSKQQMSGNNVVQYHTGNFNMLKTAQLAITEETIGLQTRLKIYEYVWVDYQLNASEYVKQRIQLIAPDNPILNITRPFDFETGGPLHSFQIIFTRKVDKRTSKFF
jgi:hypothetical protein